MAITNFMRGPWRAEFREGRAGSMYGHNISCDAHTQPGVTAGCDSIAEVRGHGDQEARANTHLIASAPDLYAALDAMLDAYEEEGAIDFSVRQKARAALNRAEGRTP